MYKRVPCKFYAKEACLKGEHCEFLHDWKDPANNICIYYQKGICTNGARCRYDHVEPSRTLLSASALTRQSSNHSLDNLVGSVDKCHHLHSASARGFHYSRSEEAVLAFSHHDESHDGNSVESRNVQPVNLPICSFFAAGDCPLGEKCPHIHGDLCPTCERQCLNPFRLEERENHKKECEKMQKHLKALKLSQDLECNICLERVLSKPILAERKFGLLTECDHSFCISCIRNWRSSSPVYGMDVNSTLRACPICRKLSYFVVPSALWYSSLEDKKEIINKYKARLRSIDCKHFNYGNGNCPFGTSCFYRHVTQDESEVLFQCRSRDEDTMSGLSNFFGDLRM